jgi:hypothetical protein
MRHAIPLIALLLVASPALAEDAPAAERVAAATKPGETQAGPKAMSGMSILGNQEAPKSLVIVPWKSSQIGDSLGLARSLDDSRQPVDREVFMRELAYHELRTQ